MKKIIFISLMLIGAGCSKPAIMSDNSPMQMNAMTKSPTDFGADTPVFLFWLDSDFAAIGSDGIQPYFEAWPSQEIDAYKTETYNTGKKYPDNDQYVYCTGFSPATLIIDDDAQNRSWTKLTVPAEDIGILDVQVAPQHITGKSSQHFETKDSKKPLEFIHAQSKIVFKAKMGTEMAMNRYLRNVTIIVPGSELMSGLKWEKGRYIASEIAGNEVSAVLTDPNSAQLDPNQMVREIGNIYIYPGQTSLTMKVEVEMSDSPLFTTSEIVSMETEVEFDLSDGLGDVLRENDAYEIILVINYDSIVLRGRKAEWQDGGKITLPIYPESNQ